MFSSRRGNRVDVSNVRSAVFKPAFCRAGVPWATFHTLRHTCATMLFRHGLNAKQVQGWLGHHAASFTMDVYVHLLPDDVGEAPDVFDQLSGLGAVPGGTDDLGEYASLRGLVVERRVQLDNEPLAEVESTDVLDGLEEKAASAEI